MDIQIQDSLDILLSSNESHHLKALQSLESLFVQACLSKGDDLKWFSALQGTFECNVVSRLIPYLTHLPISQSHISHLTITTSLIQGIVLNHSPSKAWLGRPHPLSVIVELLLASRHLPGSDTSPHPHLSSTILDTLLCILVDSPPAIRAFEQVKGVEAVVRLLKRSGTGRGVRMKCLEFLYFYLLDETLEVPMLGASTTRRNGVQELPTVPNTPTQPTTTVTKPTPTSKPKPFISATPIRPPTSRYGSSTFSFSSGSEAFSTSTLTPPESRVPSASSTTSTFTSTSPKKPSASTQPKSGIGLGRPSGPGTPRPRQRTQTPEPRTLGMLKREVEFIPQSPAGVVNPLLATPAVAPRRTHVKAKSVGGGGVEVKKALSEGVVLGQAQGRDRKWNGMGRTSSLGSSFVTPEQEPEDEDEDECRFWGSSPSSSTHSNSTSSTTAPLISPPQSTVTSPTKASFNSTEKENRLPPLNGAGQIKTTAQKTAHLSTMLGNVDALVEGVRRAGIWGVS